MNARDAIVRITSTAICGSDLHLYNGFVPTMEKGDVLGHCWHCQHGMYSTCENSNPNAWMAEKMWRQSPSDIFPTGYMGAEMCDIHPGDVVAVWGCGPVG